MEIATLVLVTPGKIRIHISDPRKRYTYIDTPDDPPSKIPSKQASTPDYDASPSRCTRSCTLAAMPQRDRDPYRTHTAISLLLVCRQLHYVASPIYYGNHAWEIGIHDRSPSIPAFRAFLNAIGDLARASIRSILIVTRYGHQCLWEGLASGWITLLRRCSGLQKIYVHMHRLWVDTLLRYPDDWTENCVEIWHRKGLEAVREVRPWQIECHNPTSPTKYILPSRATEEARVTTLRSEIRIGLCKSLGRWRP